MFFLQLHMISWRGPKLFARIDLAGRAKMISSVRAAVRIANSSARAAIPFSCLSFCMNAGNSGYGSAGWC